MKKFQAIRLADEEACGGWETRSDARNLGRSVYNQTGIMRMNAMLDE